MALPNIEDTFRVTITGAIETQVIDNVIHVLNVGGTVAEVAEDVAGAWENVLNSAGPVICNDYQAQKLVVQPLDGVTSAEDVIPDGWPINGFFTSSNPVAASTALIWTLRTGLAGRSHRGRMYIAGLPNSLLQAGGTQWTLGNVATFQAAADTFLGNLQTTVGNGSALVVASYKLATSSLVTSMLARQYLGTQRRRVN